jgi:hypothetical protein
MSNRYCALAVLALGFLAASFAVRAEQIPLRDLCSDKVIGYKDTSTGDYVFSGGRKVIRKSEIKRVDLRAARDKGLDQLSVCSKKAASRQFCWFMVEGSVGCSGCANGGVWEHCWDFQY